MENNNKLSEINEVFDNQTLAYRINGFARACNMNDLDLSRKRINNRIILKTRKKKLVENEEGKLEYVYLAEGEKTKKDDITVTETVYYIIVNPSDQSEFGNGLTISGFYKDLNFSFTNYYDPNANLDDEVLELPFSIIVYKKTNNELYQMLIKTIDGAETLFELSKIQEYKTHSANERLSFYKNIEDFSEVLKVIKSFVYNPEFIFINSSEIIKSRKVCFTTEELNKSLMQDDGLDKPYVKK